MMPLAKLADESHESEVAISRTLFDAAKVNPEIVIVHPVVSVHSAVPVKAPFIVNAPTKYE
jgi:hypothetical protein